MYHGQGHYIKLPSHLSKCVEAGVEYEVEADQPKQVVWPAESILSYVGVENIWSGSKKEDGLACTMHSRSCVGCFAGV